MCVRRDAHVKLQEKEKHTYVSSPRMENMGVCIDDAPTCHFCLATAGLSGTGPSCAEMRGGRRPAAQERGGST